MSFVDHVETEHIKTLFSRDFPDAVKAIYGTDKKTNTIARAMFTAYKMGYKAAKQEKGEPRKVV